jgi:hypothetical protein
MINTGKTYKSLPEVLEILNSSYIKEGEKVILRYYEAGTSSIEALVAIGTKTGVGPGCYTILSTSGVQIVIFTSELPDVSSLKNGQLYIWTGSSDKIIYKVYLEGTARVSEPVTSEIFVQDSSGTKYYVSSSSVKKFSDLLTLQDFRENNSKVMFLTQSEYEELSEEIKETTGNIFVICSKQQ